jgi:methanogenic corrinoid protein MtbC1
VAVKERKMKSSQLIQELVDLKEEETLALVKQELESGTDPMA